MELDIERLQENYDIIRSGKTRWRGMGATITYLDMLLMEAELGEDHNLYLYVGYNRQQSQYVRGEFIKVIEQRRIDTSNESDPWRSMAGYGHLIDVNRKSFIFSHPGELAMGRQLIGLHVDRVFFDIDLADVMDSPRLRLDVDQALMYISQSIRVRQGDVI